MRQPLYRRTSGNGSLLLVERHGVVELNERMEPCEPCPSCKGDTYYRIGREWAWGCAACNAVDKPLRGWSLVWVSCASEA